jgi:hypothetical protein
MGDWSFGFGSMVELVGTMPELSSLVEEVDLAESTTGVGVSGSIRDRDVCGSVGVGVTLRKGVLGF